MDSISDRQLFLQEFKFYDYSDIEISFSIKTEILDLQTLTDFLKLNPTRGWTNEAETYYSTVTDLARFLG